MKKLTFILIILSVSFSVYAQKGISFQGIARNPQGNAITNQTVSVKFTIGSFTETQNIDTDDFGVFSASIGSENTIEYDKLIFANMDENLKVELDGTIIYDDKFNTVPYAQAAANGVPPGCIMPFAGIKDNIPVGWLLCDGSSLAKTGMYQKIFEAIGIAWGDDGGNFLLPDLRGMFLRGTNEGRTDGWKDPSNRNVGSFQADDNKSHAHSGSTTSNGNHRHPLGTRGFEGNGLKGADGSYDDQDAYSQYAGNHTHTLNINNSGGTESRPNNAAVVYIIKY